jgi:galacturan 1,4-alpha-galacturonidase
MDKFFLVSLLGLLIVANGVSGSMMCDNNFGMLEELNNLDTEEENEVELSDIPSWTSERGGKVLVNVDSFGAVGNGEADDTEVKFFYYLQISPIFLCSTCTLHI